MVSHANEAQQAAEQFREAFERRYAADARFRGVVHVDREDGSTRMSLFRLADTLYLEMTIRPGIPQVRAGIVTDDRWKNEDLEDAIEESGDTMSEFVELGFDEVGLDWREPPVEHYRDQGKYFCFSTAFELPDVAALRDAATLERVAAMFEGYYTAFRKAIDKTLSPAP